MFKSCLKTVVTFWKNQLKTCVQKTFEVWVNFPYIMKMGKNSTFSNFLPKLFKQYNFNNLLVLSTRFSTIYTIPIITIRYII